MVLAAAALLMETGDSGTAVSAAPEQLSREQLNLGVVAIDARIGDRRVRSSGTVIDGRAGLVVTSAHTVWGATSLRLTTGLGVLHGRLVARAPVRRPRRDRDPAAHPRARGAAGGRRRDSGRLRAALGRGPPRGRPRRAADDPAPDRRDRHACDVRERAAAAHRSDPAGRRRRARSPPAGRWWTRTASWWAWRWRRRPAAASRARWRSLGRPYSSGSTSCRSTNRRYTSAGVASTAARRSCTRTRSVSIPATGRTTP